MTTRAQKIIAGAAQQEWSGWIRQPEKLGSGSARKTHRDPIPTAGNVMIGPRQHHTNPWNNVPRMGAQMKQQEVADIYRSSALMFAGWPVALTEREIGRWMDAGTVYQQLAQPENFLIGN